MLKPNRNGPGRIATARFRIVVSGCSDDSANSDCSCSDSGCSDFGCSGSDCSAGSVCCSARSAF